MGVPGPPAPNGRVGDWRGECGGEFITDPSTDPPSIRSHHKSTPTDADVDEEEEATLAGLVQRPVYSGSGSGSGSETSSSGGRSLHSKSSQASSLLSNSYSPQGYTSVPVNPAALIKPIISPDELARALAQTRVSAEPDEVVLSDSSSTRPQKGRPGSIKVVCPSYHLSIILLVLILQIPATCI